MSNPLLLGSAREGPFKPYYAVYEFAKEQWIGDVPQGEGLVRTAPPGRAKLQEVLRVQPLEVPSRGPSPEPSHLSQQPQTTLFIEQYKKFVPEDNVKAALLAAETLARQAITLPPLHLDTSVWSKDLASRLPLRRAHQQSGDGDDSGDSDEGDGASTGDGSRVGGGKRRKHYHKGTAGGLPCLLSGGGWRESPMPRLGALTGSALEKFLTLAGAREADERERAAKMAREAEEAEAWEAAALGITPTTTYHSQPPSHSQLPSSTALDDLLHQGSHSGGPAESSSRYAAYASNSQSGSSHAGSSHHHAHFGDLPSEHTSPTKSGEWSYSGGVGATSFHGSYQAGGSLSHKMLRASLATLGPDGHSLVDQVGTPGSDSTAAPQQPEHHHVSLSIHSGASQTQWEQQQYPHQHPEQDSGQSGRFVSNGTQSTGHQVSTASNSQMHLPAHVAQAFNSNDSLYSSVPLTVPPPVPPTAAQQVPFVPQLQLMGRVRAHSLNGVMPNGSSQRLSGSGVPSHADHHGGVISARAPPRHVHMAESVMVGGSVTPEELMAVALAVGAGGSVVKGSAPSGGDQEGVAPDTDDFPPGPTPEELAQQARAQLHRVLTHVSSSRRGSLNGGFLGFDLAGNGADNNSRHGGRNRWSVSGAVPSHGPSNKSFNRDRGQSRLNKAVHASGTNPTEDPAHITPSSGPNSTHTPSQPPSPIPDASFAAASLRRVDRSLSGTGMLIGSPVPGALKVGGVTHGQISQRQFYSQPPSPIPPDTDLRPLLPGVLPGGAPTGTVRGGVPPPDGHTPEDGHFFHADQKSDEGVLGHTGGVTPMQIPLLKLPGIAGAVGPTLHRARVSLTGTLMTVSATMGVGASRVIRTGDSAAAALAVFNYGADPTVSTSMPSARSRATSQLGSLESPPGGLAQPCPHPTADPSGNTASTSGSPSALQPSYDPWAAYPGPVVLDSDTDLPGGVGGGAHGGGGGSKPRSMSHARSAISRSRSRVRSSFAPERLKALAAAAAAASDGSGVVGGRGTSLGGPAGGAGGGGATARGGVPRSNSLLTRHVRDSSKSGVSLFFLQTLAGLVSSEMGKEAAEKLTTEEVVGRYIAPRTQGMSCRFTDLLPESVVSHPRYYVAHHWSGSFLYLVSSLTRHLCEEPGGSYAPQGPAAAGGPAGPAPSAANAVMQDPERIFLWLDFMAIDQHARHEPTHLIRHVQGVIANTTQTLIVLDPDGFALTRTWVLYEAWASLAATGGDRAGKLAVLAHGVTATPLLREVYASMEIHRSEATDDAERDALLDELRKAAWALASGSAPQQQHHYSSSPSPILGATASLESQPSSAALEDMRQLVAQHNSSHVLDAQSPRGRVALTAKGAVQSMGDLAAIDRQLKAAMLESSRQEAKRAEKKLRTRFASPTGYISRVAQAAVQAQLSGVPHESEALLRGVLQYMLEGQHGSTQDLLFVVTVLVGAMLDQRKVRDAVLLSRKVHDAADRILGSDHPVTTQLGLLLWDTLAAGKQFAHAEALARMLVARMERAHGPLTSPSAPAFKDGYAAVFRLGVALRNLKRYLDAERWLSTALRLHQQVYGVSHPGSVTPLMHLGRVQAALAVHGDAVSSFTQARSLLVRSYSRDSRMWVECCIDLSTSLQALGELSTAENMLRRLLNARGAGNKGKGVKRKQKGDVVTHLREIAGLPVPPWKRANSERSVASGVSSGDGGSNSRGGSAPNSRSSSRQKQRHGEHGDEESDAGEGAEAEERRADARMAGLSFEVTARLADVLLARSVTVPFRDPTKLIQEYTSAARMSWAGNEPSTGKGGHTTGGRTTPSASGGGAALPIGPPKPLGPPRISAAGGRASTTGELLEIMGLVPPPNNQGTALSPVISARPSAKSEAHSGGHTSEDDDPFGLVRKSLGAASTDSHPKQGSGTNHHRGSSGTNHQQQQKPAKWEPPPLLKRASLVLPRGFSEHWAQLLALGERMGQDPVSHMSLLMTLHEGDGGESLEPTLSGALNASKRITWGPSAQVLHGAPEGDDLHEKMGEGVVLYSPRTKDGVLGPPSLHPYRTRSSGLATPSEAGSEIVRLGPASTAAIMEAAATAAARKATTSKGFGGEKFAGLSITLPDSPRVGHGGDPLLLPSLSGYLEPGTKILAGDAQPVPISEIAPTSSAQRLVREAVDLVLKLLTRYERSFLSGKVTLPASVMGTKGKGGASAAASGAASTQHPQGNAGGNSKDRGARGGAESGGEGATSAASLRVRSGRGSNTLRRARSRGRSAQGHGQGGAGTTGGGSSKGGTNAHAGGAGSESPRGGGALKGKASVVLNLPPILPGSYIAARAREAAIITGVYVLPTTIEGISAANRQPAGGVGGGAGGNAAAGNKSNRAGNLRQQQRGVRGVNRVGKAGGSKVEEGAEGQPKEAGDAVGAAGEGPVADKGRLSPAPNGAAEDASAAAADATTTVAGDALASASAPPPHHGLQGTQSVTAPAAAGTGCDDAVSGSVFASAVGQNIDSPRKVAPPAPTLSLPTVGGNVLQEEISLAIAAAMGRTSIKAARGSSTGGGVGDASAGAGSRNILRTTSTVKTDTLPALQHAQKQSQNQHGPGSVLPGAAGGVVVPLPKIKYRTALPKREPPPPGTRQLRYPIRKSGRAGTGNTSDGRGGGTRLNASSTIKHRGPGGAAMAGNRGGAQLGAAGALAEGSAAPGAAESAAAAAAAAETAQKDAWREQLLALTESLTARAEQLRDGWELAAATTALEAAMNVAEAILGPSHTSCINAVAMSVDVLVRQRRFGEARSLLSTYAGHQLMGSGAKELLRMKVEAVMTDHGFSGADEGDEELVYWALDLGGSTIRGAERLLVTAAALGYVEVCRVVLAINHTATRDEEGVHGMRALATAAGLGHYELVMLLLDSNPVVDASDWRGLTALAHACRSGQYSCVRLLLDRGKANPNTRDQELATPLMHAAANGHLAVLSILIEYKANPDLVDTQGRTALMYAARAGQAAALELLLRCHTRSNIRDRDGCTALIHASKGGHQDCCYVLLCYKCDVDYVDNREQSAMMKAARGGYVGIVEMLLRESADPGLRDLDGRSALHLAAGGGHALVCGLLVLFAARGAELAGSRLSTGGGGSSSVNDAFVMGVPIHIRLKVDEVLAARGSEAAAASLDKQALESAEVAGDAEALLGSAARTPVAKQLSQAAGAASGRGRSAGSNQLSRTGGMSMKEKAVAYLAQGALPNQGGGSEGGAPAAGGAGAGGSSEDGGIAGAGTGEGGGSASVGGPVDPSLSHTSLISATQLDLKVLLAYSILPQVRTYVSSSDKYGQTAADLAKDMGHHELARLLRHFMGKQQHANNGGGGGGGQDGVMGGPGATSGLKALAGSKAAQAGAGAGGANSALGQQTQQQRRQQLAERPSGGLVTKSSVGQQGPASLAEPATAAGVTGGVTGSQSHFPKPARPPGLAALQVGEAALQRGLSDVPLDLSGKPESSTIALGLSPDGPPTLSPMGMMMRGSEDGIAPGAVPTPKLGFGHLEAEYDM